MSDASVITDKSVKLRDGRTLGYAEFGVSTGRPIFLFSGTSSRLFYPVESSVALALNARVITVERPGLGLSDFQPGRTLLDWQGDIQQLADALGLERFAVAGGSAGGPYAAAAIQVKTHLWQGEQDVNVPLPMGWYLARAIPNCQARFLPNEGHLMTLNHWPEIVSALVE